jgi:asparagine synthetase B (glutamine-hydrolysing)
VREHSGLELEPTDALVYEDLDGSVLVARGGAATFPLYWLQEGGNLHVSTRLPVLEGARLSRSGLAAAVAGACVHGSYEPNGFTATPLHGWRRARRASELRFEPGRLTEERLHSAGRNDPSPGFAGVVSEVRAAFDAYSRSQARIATSVVELSGGFDSTLAAAIPARAGMRGISVVFPYYEFRFESAVQRATAEHLGVERLEVDGMELFPYSAPEVPARFDEPSVFVTGIRHAERVARFARDAGAQCIYNGHGGDQLFATDLLAQETVVGNPPSRAPFSASAWTSISRATEELRRSPWMDRRLATFVYDARPDVWVKETFGPTLRTPFSDLRVFRSALAWSEWCRSNHIRPDKSILAEAARDLLPSAVLERRGKVAYDGIWMRAYRRHAAHIGNVFDQASASLEHIGISVAWLQRRVRDLADWREVSDREVLASYAIATWLNAWGLERLAQPGWVD